MAKTSQQAIAEYMQLNYKEVPCEHCGQQVLKQLENICSLCEEIVEENFGEGIQQDRKVGLLKKLFENK